MKILAIDQSYTHCAYCVTEGTSIIDFGVLVSNTDTDVYKRSLDLALRLGGLYLKHQPKEIRLEGLAFGMRGNATRDLSGLLFTIINVISHLHVFDNFRIIAPTQVKKAATGSGKAKKKEMIEALPPNILKLFKDQNFKQTTGLTDLADAYWISQVK
ncbi:MAG: crossover junction endodeoxyribonuclease RuvC [Thaumarchaeota archaeon]|nr:crossover junction endodeoxyribonuclease RuvC [Nitrososphaerota archaeon]